MREGDRGGGNQSRIGARPVAGDVFNLREPVIPEPVERIGITPAIRRRRSLSGSSWRGFIRRIAACISSSRLFKPGSSLTYRSRQPYSRSDRSAFRQRGIVGHDRAAIAQRAEVLRGIETECRRVSPGARFVSAHRCPVRLRASSITRRPCRPAISITAGMSAGCP